MLHTGRRGNEARSSSKIVRSEDTVVNKMRVVSILPLDPFLVTCGSRIRTTDSGKAFFDKTNSSVLACLHWYIMFTLYNLMSRVWAILRAGQKHWWTNTWTR